MARYVRFVPSTVSWRDTVVVPAVTMRPRRRRMPRRATGGRGGTRRQNERHENGEQPSHLSCCPPEALVTHRFHGPECPSRAAKKA